MIETGLKWMWHRLRPAEGWLSFLLLSAIATTLVTAITAVGWVPEEAVVIWTAYLGLLLAALLAQRSLSWLPAWGLILGYGLVVTTIYLGRLWPPMPVMASGWEPASAYVRQNWGLFADRVVGWLSGALGQGRSEETIVFAFGLGLLAWSLVAYATWSAFRQHRPLPGLTILGFALALNCYYGDVAVWPLAMFIGLAALLVAVIHFADQEKTWDSKGVDYPGDIRFDLLTHSSGIALFLLFIASAVPAINLRALSQAVLDRPGVHETEETLGQVFAGVRQPYQEQPGFGAGLEPGGSGGALPRSFLLGEPPVLYETVIMTATVQGDVRALAHWRGLSYDVYTGRGWALSAERREPIAAQEPIALPAIRAGGTLTQTVHLATDRPGVRFTLGLPLQFDQRVIVFWRGLEDLSRVESSQADYSAVSRLSTATPSDLRQASLADVPPAVMARYTALPDTIPSRVHELAQQVAGGERVGGQAILSPYDQAKALERFLRQYPYSLDVELPPPGRDPVDYFLFDLQTGYCDYYASAMVVMARSLGLPARFAAGFLAQPADAGGVQTVYQINAHSWAEVYFTGYGWLEFEPTAAFPAAEPALPMALPPEFGPEELAQLLETPPIPRSGARAQALLWALALLPSLALLGWWLWLRRGQTIQLDGTRWAYGRLLRRARHLGQPTPLSQTPAEFQSQLFDRLGCLERQKLTGWIELESVYPEIEQLTASFVVGQYGRERPPSERTVAGWRRIRGRLWLLGLLGRLNDFLRALSTKRRALPTQTD